jgi:hypothetical protein
MTDPGTNNDLHDSCSRVEEADAAAYRHFGLLAAVQSIAHKRYGGHYTVMKFTTGYKAVFGTPTLLLGHEDSDKIYELPTAETMDDALADLLQREAFRPNGGAIW